MTDKERIRAEVDRMLNKEWKWHSSTEAKYRCEVYRELLEFIDSLPEEPVSEDLEEAAFEYFKQGNFNFSDKSKHYIRYNGFDLIAAFKAGANWKKQHDIDKACEWLEDHADEFQDSYDPVCNNDELVEAFRKAMED